MHDVGHIQRRAGQDAINAGQHQTTGGAEKAADHRIGNKADGAAETRQTEAAKQESGQRRAQRQHHQSRRQEAIVEAVRAKSHRERADERGNHRAGRAVGSADRKGQRAAPRRDRPADRAGDESRRETVGQPRRERPREDQRRIGHVEENGEYADHDAGDGGMRQRGIQSTADKADECPGLNRRIAHASPNSADIRDGSDA